MFEDTDSAIDTIRGKWAFEGAETLSEAARMLREFAQDLENLENQGWQFNQPVQDDYGYMEKVKNDTRVN